MRRFNFMLDNGTRLTIQPPTLKTYYNGFVVAKTDSELFQSIADICDKNDENIPVDTEYILNNFTVDDLNKFVEKFPQWVQNERDSDPN